jgi:gliding motility-associated-like protein
MVSGISNPAVSDQKTNKITETLVNTTNTPVDVTYYILPVANGCDGRTFSYTVTVNPTITVTSAASASICNNTPQSYTITSDVTGATFRWSRPTVAGITNAPVSNQASNTIAETLNNTTNAPITVTYVISPTFNSCTGGTFSYSVTVNPTARVTGSATARICNKTAQNYNITSAVSGTSFTWSRADVAGISNAAVMNQTSNIIAETLVNTTSQPIAVPYTIQPAANGCDGATFTYTITVDPTPETPAVTSNAPICLGSNLYLKASTVTGASYRWTGPNGFTSTSQAPSITNVTQAAEGNYEVIAVVNGCESLAGTTSVSISNTGSITKAGSDQVVCGNKALVTLNGSITGGSGTGIWSTSGTGEFGNASSLSTDYTPSAADIASGSVIVTLTSTDNGVCAATSSSAKVTITPAPVADAGQDLAICADRQASLSSGIRIASGVLWTTSGSGTFYPSNTDIKPKYIPSQADKTKGSVKLTMTTTGNGNCNSVTDSTLLTIIPLPYVKAGGERTVLEGHIIKLVPTVSGTNLQYLWTPNRYLSNNTSKDVEVKGVKDETYTITVTGTGGCVSQDEIAIKVLKLFDVPNTFTPNGDGINDTWQIPNLAQYPNCKVLIFNRYGQIVYESVGYSQPWDGLMNGKNVPFGTYYYIIDTGTGSTPRKGFVTLIK